MDGGLLIFHRWYVYFEWKVTFHGIPSVYFILVETNSLFIYYSYHPLNPLIFFKNKNKNHSFVFPYHPLKPICFYNNSLIIM